MIKNLEQLIDGLTALGFTGGYVAGGEPVEILLWENDEPQPTLEEIESFSLEGEKLRKIEEIRHARHAAYSAPDGSDSVFLKYQRGEATEQDWLDSMQSVKDANPYPDEVDK